MCSKTWIVLIIVTKKYLSMRKMPKVAKTHEIFASITQICYFTIYSFPRTPRKQWMVRQFLVVLLWECVVSVWKAFLLGAQSLNLVVLDLCSQADWPKYSSTPMLQFNLSAFGCLLATGKPNPVQIPPLSQSGRSTRTDLFGTAHSWACLVTFGP